MFPKENEINNGRKRKESYIQMHYNEFYAYLFNNYDFCESFVEKLYCYYNNITERPACRFCGNKIKFISFTKGYKKFCSSKCAANSVETRNKAKQTCLKKYGADNPSKTEQTKNKIANTKIERYNDKNFNNRNKYKQTCLERYGVESPFASDIIKDKIKQTCLERYGIEKYVLSNDHEVKTKRTCLIRYNTENYTQSNEYKNMLPTIQQKIYETKKNNNSFNKSNIEEQFASWLDENNILYIRQYKSEQYPFCCDFYFPEKDLYFEINGHWSHGLHPFDENNEDDKRKVGTWKQKGTEYYNNAIKTWTIADPLKVKTAKENNLNFKVFYSCNLNEVINEYER